MSTNFNSLDLDQYYNNYDPSKDYTELLFRAGKVLQSKEVNEVQSMLKHHIKSIGDTILTDGDVIEGCQLVIDLEKSQVSVTAGKIYLEGNVRTVSEITSIPITGSGQEIIGVMLESDVITPEDDESLKDIASGYDNYNRDGAYRLHETVKFTLNNPKATTLYVLQDGQQMAVNNAEDLTQLDKMQATLARRTFDESGNYKVNGLTLVDKNYHDADNIYISVESGKAYVRGYEVEKPVATSVGIKKAIALRSIVNEPKIYSTGTQKYVLNNDYVNDIKRIVGSVQVTQKITRGYISGGIDPLPLTPVVKVVSVKHETTTYNEGEDFQLTSDGIDWSLEGEEPDGGTSYDVVWQYNKTMAKDTDYKLTQGDGGSVKGYVEFLSGDKPVDRTTFLVDYSFGLCRRDNVCIDRNGSIIVTPGQSDILRLVESPAIDNTNVLTLGSVLVKPKSDEIEIINNNTKAISMLGLYRLVQRISDLEYNQAVTDLDKEAAAGELPTELIGVFTDGFIGMSKADVNHSEWSASIDMDNAELTLPFTQHFHNLTIADEPTAVLGEFGRIATAPYTEKSLVSQLNATRAFRVNEYDAFPKTPVVTLDPEIDTWVDENVIKIDDVETKTITLRRWWYHKNEAWAAQEKLLWQQYGYADGGESLEWNNGTATHEVVETLKDEATLYMRQRSVNFTVNSLAPNVDNIVATFDGKPIRLEPLTPDLKGTAEGSLKANARGTTSGHFTVPANTLCGTRELKVYATSTPSLAGTANYTASGRTITKQVFTERVTIQASDPLAQSFQLDQDQYITGVSIYFNDKDALEPITVQLRNMVNGYPGTTIYAEKVIQGIDIKTSEMGAEETRITFDNPVFCNANTQYCFTVMSNSNTDSVWIAETNNSDVATQEQIAKNPYLAGMMFSSSNALTWTAHQAQDLKFQVYGASFESAGSATFELLTAEENPYDRILITSEEFVPAGTTVQWQYSVNEGDWMPIETYDDRELATAAESVQVRVQITATENVSPAIALDGLMLVGFKNEVKAVYVSRNVHLKDGFNNVKQMIDLNLPVGCNVKMYYATDTTGTDWTEITAPTQSQVSNKYTTYTFNKSLGQTAHEYRVKVELTTPSQVTRPTAKNLMSVMKTVD